VACTVTVCEGHPRPSLSLKENFDAPALVLSISPARVDRDGGPVDVTCPELPRLSVQDDTVSGVLYLAEDATDAILKASLPGVRGAADAQWLKEAS
jgi:hypothetical protein